MSYADEIWNDPDYCGTCKQSPCLVNSGEFCCHDLVRYGFCSHDPLPDPIEEEFWRDMESRQLWEEDEEETEEKGKKEKGEKEKDA